MLNACVLIGIVENMRIDMRKHQVIIAAVLFCFVSLALALHHDDAPFQTVTGTICKVQNASSAAPHKIRTDSTSAQDNLPTFLSNTVIARSGWVPEADSFHPSLLHFSAFSNKAPPFSL